MHRCRKTKTKTGDSTWNISLQNPNKIIGLVFVCGVIGARNLAVKSLWENSWKCSIFPRTMKKDRFLKVMRFLHFYLKVERRRNLLRDKFEQLLLCKARCKFMQYMANKPDKIGLKFCSAIDVQISFQWISVTLYS